MADTIVNNTPSGGSGDGSAGWAVAVIILLAVIAGGFVWYRYHRSPAPAQPNAANINVTIPNPIGGSQNGSPEGSTNPSTQPTQ